MVFDLLFNQNSEGESSLVVGIGEHPRIMMRC